MCSVHFYFDSVGSSCGCEVSRILSGTCSVIIYLDIVGLSCSREVSLTSLWHVL